MAGNSFDWILTDQLGACVNPSVAVGAASELRERYIRLLINLHERPDPPALLVELQAETVHLPVQNSDAPTQEQLDRGVAVIRDALSRGVRVAVHCGAGLGRSGTLLAAYLVSQGSSPDKAMEQVRTARPGSIENLEQENAVHHFAHRLASDRS